MAETPLPPYRELVSSCESYLQYGDSPRGVGWLRDDADIRYRVMLEVIRPSEHPVMLLDFGCGLSHLYEYIIRHRLPGITYSGLDLSERFLALARKRFPAVSYHHVDVLDPSAAPLPAVDYVIMNGLFNYKGRFSYTDMFAYLRALVRRVFDLATLGIAFNVMSKQVEWERDDLFHLPVDDLLTFLSHEVSRHVVVRHDYGLFEYTTFVYKRASAPEQVNAKLLLSPPGAC